jgi:hypothetical protein
MISLSATHRRRAYTKADQIVDIVSADFSEWEDILEGDTVVLTCKFRRRGADAIFYEVWEYFFSKVELENDHPAMQDAIADGHDPDQAEFISYVPLTHVRTMDGEPWVV